MESSSPSGKTAEIPGHRWSNFIGTTIAILTLTIPLLAIANYSSLNDHDSLGRNSYSLMEHHD
ncbi:MAG: hypothetical protein N5P05_002774 [Chroococcopsis gigantea SAG 12.99]|jgi:hypothetical protein|nr:hypothetical protein [Chroococcopsis gigantea SAG 12.99]